MKKIDIKLGDTYGKLTILNEVFNHRERKFLCKCECGEKKVIFLSSLRTGKTTSCGCVGKEALKIATLKHGHNRRGNPSKTYTTWGSMISRCKDNKRKDYGRYGGRGIKVCKRWEKFKNFLADMGEKPKELTLERVDNNKGYSLNNCKWATVDEQANNKRNNILISYKGKTQNATQWANELNIDREILYDRKKAGFTDKQIIEHKKYANKR